MKAKILALTALSLIVFCAPASGQRYAKPITLKDGSATLRGTVKKDADAWFKFKVAAGKTVSLRLESADETVELTFTYGTSQLAGEGSNNTREWSGTVDDAGEYFLNVHTFETRAPVAYKLELTVK